MKSLAQMWMTFTLANITPIGHVSDLNMPRCFLVYSIMREDYSVNVARVISDEIYKFANQEVSPTNERAKGSFGFPALITALCAEHGVEVDPSEKIKPPMDARYIRQFCVNPAENPQAQQQPPSPPHVADEQLMFYDKLSAIEASLQNLQLRQDHMMLQHSTTYKGIMYLEEGLYNAVPQDQYNQWMPPDQFHSYMAWPGDRPDFYRGSAAAGTSNAAGPDDGTHDQQDAEDDQAEYDTDLDRIMRGE